MEASYRLILVISIDYQGRRIRLDTRMHEALTFALGSPTIWHAIGPEPKMGAAIRRLAAKGLVEIAEHSNQFRIKS